MRKLYFSFSLGDMISRMLVVLLILVGAQHYTMAQAKVAYVTMFESLTTEGAEDPIIPMLEADPNIDLTVIEHDADDTDGPLDLSGYDVVVAQEPWSSSSTIYQPGRTLGLANIPVPFIFNKAFALVGGRAFAAGVAGGGGEVPGTEGTLALTVEEANQSHDLFKGMSFTDNAIQVFETWGNDAGAIQTATDASPKGLQYVNNVEISEENTLLGLPGDAPETATMSLNDIPAGATIGGETLQARMINMCFNYGAMAAGGGNLTAEGLTLWRNAVYSLAGLDVPNTLVEITEEIVFITSDNRDSVQIEWLQDQGFVVNTWWPAAHPAVSADEVEALNSADLVIIGRSPNSGSVGAMKDVLNDVWMPVMNNNQFGSRSGNMNWFNSNSAGHREVDGVQNVHVKLPEDPAFEGITLGEGDSLGYTVGLNHSFLLIDAATLDASNAEVVAANDDLVAIARFDAGEVWYPETEEKPLGHRTYFGFGNDEADVLFFPLTDDAKTVYFNEITRLIGLGDSGLRPEAAAVDDATLESISVNGTVILGFDPETTSYVVTVPSGTTDVPEVTAMATSSNATVEVTDADDINGTTTILVTAEDGTTTITYSITFEVDGGPVAGRKLIAVLGNGPDDAPNSHEVVLMDSLKQYVNVIYMNAGTFNAASADSLYNTLGIEGIVASESIGGPDLENFGSARDNFRVPSIIFEAAAYTQAWADDFMTDPEDAIWGFGTPEEVDLQWVIKDNLHPAIQPLEYDLGQTITYTSREPGRGVPYLHGFETTVNVIAVGGRVDGGTVTDYDQNQAVAVAEFPIQQSFFMNIAMLYHDPGMGSQDFFNILRQAAIYMFDISETDDPTSVKDVADSSVKIYPNPVQQEMHIDFLAKANQEAVLSLINLSGQKVLTVRHIANPGLNKAMLSLNNLQAGMYLIQIEVDGETISSRIVLK